MATNATHAVQQAAIVRHALLALLGALAYAALPDDTTLDLVRELATYADDPRQLKAVVERILREHSHAAGMDNVVRLCHELRGEIKQYQRIPV